MARTSLVLLAAASLLYPASASPRSSEASSPVSPLGFTWGRAYHAVRDWGYLSCPSTRLCVLAGIDHNAMYVSTNPARSGSFRTFVASRSSRVRTLAMTCPQTHLCVAAADSPPSHQCPPVCVLHPNAPRPVVAITDPASGFRQHHTVAEVVRGAFNFSCSGHFCAAVGDTTYAFSAQPARRGSWVIRDHNPQQDAQIIDCSAEEVCIGLSEGRIKTIYRPRNRDHRWYLSNLGQHESDGRPENGTCIDTFCLVPTSNGQIFASQVTQTGKPTGWTRTDPQTGSSATLHCVSAMRCYALTGSLKTHAHESFLYSEDAFSPTPHWQSVEMPSTPRADAADFQCPSADSCFFVFSKGTSTGKGTGYWNSWLMPVRISAEQQPGG